MAITRAGGWFDVILAANADVGILPLTDLAACPGSWFGAGLDDRMAVGVRLPGPGWSGHCAGRAAGGSLPALRTPPRQRGCSLGQPGRRDPRHPQAPARTPANLRQNRSRTTNQAHRRSHLHHQHHKVESPEMGHNSGNLRAVGRWVTICFAMPLLCNVVNKET